MTEKIELSDQDQQDLAQMYAEPDADKAPTFHPILRVWREVLAPAAAEREKKVTPQWASRITSAYGGIEFADMNEFRYRYFDKLADLAAVIDFEISTDDECLSYTTPEEDVEHNSHHYKNVLRDWQCMFLSWELEWDCTDEWAAVELAAISEIHKMFFGPTGLTQFLDNIKFEFTEADQADLAAALDELRSEA